jgi:hypothetical protein
MTKYTVTTIAQTLINLNADSFPASAQAAIAKATASARHQERMAATYAAAKVELGGDLVFGLILDQYSPTSQRIGELANLGKGRHQASDGGAWGAAARRVIQTLTAHGQVVVTPTIDEDGDLCLVLSKLASEPVFNDHAPDDWAASWLMPHEGLRSDNADEWQALLIKFCERGLLVRMGLAEQLTDEPVWFAGEPALWAQALDNAVNRK